MEQEIKLTLEEQEQILGLYMYLKLSDKATARNIQDLFIKMIKNRKVISK